MKKTFFDRDIYFRIISFARPHLVLFFFSLVLALLTVFFELAIPVLTRHVIDNYITIKYHKISMSENLKEEVYTGVDGVVMTGSGSIYVRSSTVNNLSKEALAIIRSEDLLSDEFYYLSTATGAERLALTSSFCKIDGDYTVVPIAKVKELSREERNILRRDDLNYVIKFGWMVLVFVVLNFFSTYGEILLVSYAGGKVIHGMRMALYNKVVNMPMSYFDNEMGGKIVTRLTNDIANVEEFFNAVFVNIFKDVLLLSGILGVLLFIDLRLGFFTLLLVPVVVFVSMTFRIRMRDAFRKVRETLSLVNSRLSETINGMNVIQIFNREKEYDRRFRQDNHDYYRASVFQVMVNAIFNPVISFIRFTGMGIVIYLGAKEVLAGMISLGTLVVFISYLEKFFQPIQDIAEKINIMQSAMASSERIFALMDEEKEVDREGNLFTPNDIIDSHNDAYIQFKDVSFSYNGVDQVFSDFNLTIKQGESVALVGATGCGKTTIINLLSRMYLIDRGAITIKGVNINDIPKKKLRSLIGVVQQNVTLFADTVANNILLGKDLKNDRLEAICRESNCLPFIKKLSQGADTVLSEGGMSISFGERQLVSFARILVYDPEIFILDEATANIDIHTEQLIQETLDRILKKKTSIVVAHRLSTIQHCDRIIVMDKGCIVEQGSHSELLAKKGRYYRLYLLQYKEHIDDEDLDFG